MSRIAEDFGAIEQAVRESSRGRWFLEEHAKRIRQQETAILLQAMGKLESAVTSAHDRLEERLCLALGLGPPRPAANSNQLWRDDDIFETPAQPGPVVTLPAASRQGGAQGRARNRIVLIRRGIGERIEVPLQEEAAGAS